MSPTTAVIIVAYRSADHLAQGLPVLAADPAVGDVVVVDNSRDPATAAVVADVGGKVRYVDPGGNIGFARGCNLGLRSSSDPIVTFLNPDVLLVRSLAGLVQAVADGGRLLGGGLTAGPDDDRLGNARRRVTLRMELGRAVLGSGRSQVPLTVGQAVVPVDQVDGALITGSRNTLEALGGFDERFELYFEDVDLCDRARAMVGVFLDTVRYGVHAGGSSARSAGTASYCAFRISRVRYLAKRHGRAGAIAGAVLTVAEALVRALTRQPEGGRVRRLALRLVLQELRRPGSVCVLDQNPPFPPHAPTGPAPRLAAEEV